jgi:hypothetical protein
VGTFAALPTAQWQFPIRQWPPGRRPLALLSPRGEFWGTPVSLSALPRRGAPALAGKQLGHAGVFQLIAAFDFVGYSFVRVTKINLDTLNLDFAVALGALRVGCLV